MAVELKKDEKAELAQVLGLSRFEYDEILKRLSREPNKLEIYLFSAMWSEHCGYKHSRKYLSQLPRRGAVFTDENSGGIKIGKYIVFFKTESHNHPSAVEPYQGAATGIGGILRDILAMNARPIALLNSLKFGPVESRKGLAGEGFSENSGCAGKFYSKNKYLLNGVVEGISDYGNSVGVPTIAGEVDFNECYNLSPLVNVAAVGICREDEVKKAAARENALVVLIGSATGRDGLGGAAFASKELQNTDTDRISVQIGDPYTKKNVIEATLKILKSKNVFSCQDLGAAGLLSSTAEMAQKGKVGIELYLERVLLREKGMKPHEIMLSESQERMIFTCSQKGADEIFEICKKYEINAEIIGKTKKGGDYSLFMNGQKLCSLDVNFLTNPPVYELSDVKPKEKAAENGVMDFVPPEKVCVTKDLITKFVASPEFASKNYIFRQYDSTVGARTLKDPHSLGVAPLNMFETGKVIGFSMDSNEKQCAIDPYQGAFNLVFESFRNAVSSGFQPLGITNCLNFANPENEEVAYQFRQTVSGMKDALETLEIPVVSGNVSFYNEGAAQVLGDDNGKNTDHKGGTRKIKIYPTPVICTLSVLKAKKPIYARFSGTNDTVFLIGKKIDKNSKTGGSLYQKIFYGITGGKVDEIDTQLEFQLRKTIFDLAGKKWLKGAIDVSKGGILGALTIMMCNSGNNTGFNGQLTDDLDLLMGEITGRYIISGDKKIENYLVKNNVPYEKLGETNDSGIFDLGFTKIKTADLKEIYFNSLESKI